jgi:hypothetical protein
MQADAHAVCGDRIFPVTLTLDDPGVADEASLPTFIWQRSGADDGPGPVHSYGFGLEYDKRITQNFGLGVGTGWNVIRTAGAPTRTGFDNLDLTAKYQACVSPGHELVVSFGVQRTFGGTGTLQTGGDRFGATAPTLYFGKGLGDLPVPWLRPFAITGELSYSVADRALKASSVPDPDTGLIALQYNQGSANQWFGGIALQYSLPYLQAQVRDLGLPGILGRLTPLLEVTWSSPATAPSAQGTTWTLAPGLLYSGGPYQLGVALLVPANRAAGSNVGVIAQFHLYLDDLLPGSVLGRPLFDF